MKKMLILVLALSVMFTVAGFAQDMSKDSGTAAPAAPLKNIKGTVKADGDKLTFRKRQRRQIMGRSQSRGPEGT